MVCLPYLFEGAQWLSGRVLEWRPRGLRFEPHRRHCVVSLSKNINPSLVLVQPRQTCPFITERLLMGRKESNQTNKQNLSFCMPGNFFLIFLPLQVFDNITFYQNILSEVTLECQMAWIHVRPDILSGLIWVQTVFFFKLSAGNKIHC